MSDSDDQLDVQLGVELDAIEVGLYRQVRAEIAGRFNVEAGLGAIVETHRHKPERDRFTAEGTSTDGSKTTLLVVHEMDGAWTIHGLGAPGVTLSRIDALFVAESILERAQRHGEGA